MQPQKRPAHGTHAKVQQAASAENDYPVPDGCKKLLGIDRKRWKQLTGTKEQWTKGELLNLYELILSYADLDAVKAESEGVPRIMERPSGEPAVHPIHLERGRAEKAVQNWLRIVGLNTSPDRAAASKGMAVKPTGEDGPKPSPVSRLIG